jgi:hypothetical protein
MRGLSTTNLLLLVIAILLGILCTRGRQDVIASANAQTTSPAVYLYGCYETSGQCTWKAVHVTAQGVLFTLK